MAEHLQYPLTDTHCHLDQYPDDVPPLEEDELGEIRVISMSLSPADFVHFRDVNPFPHRVYPALGLFPDTECLTDYTLDRMLDHIPESKFIGEVGLDYVSTDEDFRRKQRRAFDRILDKAAENVGSVISIHSRRAAKDVVDRFSGGFPGIPILHWFSGSVELIEQAKDTCYFSINTAMAGSEAGRKRIRAMPRDRLLLESDGPYILLDEKPVVPRDLVNVIQFFSGEWACSMDETAKRLDTNADRLFD